MLRIQRPGGIKQHKTQTQARYSRSGIHCIVRHFRSVLCGCLSDKLHRRKVFVIAGCMAMCCVALVYAGIEGEYAYPVAIALAFIFGKYACTAQKKNHYVPGNHRVNHF